MANEFKFPDVGEGITEGKLVHWKVKVGDDIKIDDAIAEVETDKATVDIPSPFTGKVTELIGNDGDTLHVGDVIMKIDSENISTEVKESENVVAEAKVEVTPVKKEIKVEETNNAYDNINHSLDVLAMPSVRSEAKSKGIDLSTIKATGNHGQITFEDLDSGEKVVEEVKPVEKEIPKVEEIKLPAEKVEVDENVEEIDVSDIAKEQERREKAAKNKDIIATPSVRQLARDLDIDINFVLGSGEGGKILEEDINRAKELREKHGTPKIENKKVESIKEEVKIEVSKEIGAVETSIEDEVIPIKGIRKVIAERMLESLQKSAQVTHSDEANISELVELRLKEKDRLKDKGIRLSYLTFFVKAYIETAKEFPMFNAIVNDEKQEVILRKEYNIAIAVDTPKGLLVPVVNNCEHKSIIDIAKEINELAELAREGKLTGEQMRGSTFTISSVGSLGGQVFTPIINYPEVAILGIGKIIKKPIVNSNNEIVIGDMVTFSLTFDHRIVDGADAARFLKRYIELIENPEEMLMNLE